jgi:hypothetical protein
LRELGRDFCVRVSLFLNHERFLGSQP